MQDLENNTLFENIKSFAKKINEMHDHLEKADKLYYKYQKERYFLDAVEIYCNTINCLLNDLSLLNLKSRGLLAFREYLTNYVNSDVFISLKEETEKLIDDLSAVKYCILIKGNAVKISKYEDEPDYSVEVESTFEKFKQGAVKDYLVKFSTPLDMNHIEAKVLD